MIFETILHKMILFFINVYNKHYANFNIPAISSRYI